VKTADRVCPKPVVVVVSINGQSCRALVDSGSFSDSAASGVFDIINLDSYDLILGTPFQLEEHKLLCLSHAQRRW
jgi:hypothetical protein